MHSPSLELFCDCFNDVPITSYTARNLACGHAYHNECFARNEYKCLYCLKFIEDSVDEQVQSLLEHLKWDYTGTTLPEECNDVIPEEDDDERETTDNISVTWDMDSYDSNRHSDA